MPHGCAPNIIFSGDNSIPQIYLTIQRKAISWRWTLDFGRISQNYPKIPQFWLFPKQRYFKTATNVARTRAMSSYRIKCCALVRSYLPSYQLSFRFIENWQICDNIYAIMTPPQIHPIFEGGSGGGHFRKIGSVDGTNMSSYSDGDALSRHF